MKVPKPIFLCSDRTISDEDFYVMEYIGGETISDNVIASKYSSNEKRSITTSFVKSLVELHDFDVLNSDLSDLGKHEKYVERQIQRWSKQFNSQKIRDIDDLDLATKILIETLPTQQKVSIVHGDYRLDNVRIENNKVAAILDWELCTLGDPLADLGTIIASWSNSEEKDTPFIYSPSLSGGFLSRSEILSIYESNTSLDLKDIEFYVRLSFWKHAMIMEGVYVRYSLGYYGDVEKKEIDAFAQSTLNSISFNKSLISTNSSGIRRSGLSDPYKRMASAWLNRGKSPRSTSRWDWKICLIMSSMMAMISSSPITHGGSYFRPPSRPSSSSPRKRSRCSSRCCSGWCGC